MKLIHKFSKSTPIPIADIFKFRLICSQTFEYNILRLHDDVESNTIKFNTKVLFYSTYYFINNICK